jgi:hypothetical protein
MMKVPDHVYALARLIHVTRIVVMRKYWIMYIVMRIGYIF